MQFPLIPAIALVAFIACSTNAASIKKMSPLDKQLKQEKIGKASKVNEPDENALPVDADKKGADVDHRNGKVSEQEYAAFLKRREEEYQNELRSGLKETLKDFDKNADGKLQAEEILHLLASTRNLRPKIPFKPIFAELDGNSDGALDLDELEFFLQHTPWNLLEEIPSSEFIE